MYSHSSYFREIPYKFLKDSYGRNIDKSGNLTGNIEVDNPYCEDFREKWIKAPNHNKNNMNPSIPILVRPTKPQEGVHYHETPH
ncbi:hypothetical protein ABX014_08130 [Snodgrassella alvi]|uniref:hypothetical protein n=1 Tax=Snodgrassella alvi TaxID=1196083 RepID=UPI003460DB62